MRRFHWIRLSLNWLLSGDEKRSNLTLSDCKSLKTGGESGIRNRLKT